MVLISICFFQHLHVIIIIILSKMTLEFVLSHICCNVHFWKIDLMHLLFIVGNQIVLFASESYLSTMRF
jgi:hypothetical protein